MACLRVFAFEKKSLNTVDSLISQPIPEPRSGHRILTDDNDIYSIGGYNPDYQEEETLFPLFRELWKFNIISRKWKRLKTKGHMPLELASHSAILCGRNLLVFGGTGVPFGDAASNLLHACNLESLTWNEISCTGAVPTKVYGHTMCFHNDHLYVFGGTTGWEYNAELYRLHMRSRVWEYLELTQQPPPRYRHEAVVYDNRLYVFGGGKATATYNFLKIHVFNFDEMAWDIKDCVPDAQFGFPPARRCHSCVLYKEYMYMCGGYNGHTIHGDLWKFSLTKFLWLKLPKCMPVPVYFHSATITTEGCMYIFGGVTQIEDVRTHDIYSVWLEVPSLKQLVWHIVQQSLGDLATLPKHELHELGIPLSLLDQIT